MRVRLFALVMTMCVVTASLLLPSPDRTKANAFDRPQRLIVTFRDSTLPFGAEDLIRGFGGNVVRSLPEIGVLVVESAGPSVEDLSATLRAEPGILAVGRDLPWTLGPMTDAVVDGVGSDVVAEGHTPDNFPFQNVTSDDAFYPSQQWSLTRIGAVPATWDHSTGSGVTIAVIDSGVSSVHPDIAPNLVSSSTFVDVSQDTPQCDDGGVEDQLGHGTLVASLAAGARGPRWRSPVDGRPIPGLVVGVAPDARIRSYKVIRRFPFTGFIPPQFDTPFNRCLVGSGEGEFSWILAGFNQAVNDGVDVISMSVGGFINKTDVNDVKTVYTAMLRATNRAAAQGIVVVASAGNTLPEGLNLNALGPLVHLPSELPHVINGVATTNPAAPPPAKATGVDYLASYSNFGSSLHGIAAPGGEGPVPPNDRFVRGACSPGVPGKLDATSAFMPPATTFGCFNVVAAVGGITSNHVWYVRSSGTSFAAPHVAGVAALVKAANPGLTSAQIRVLLQRTAEDIGKVGYDQLFNFGLVDACRAVAVASNPSFACP